MALADIDTVVIVILENRSFDHMLGYLSLPGPNRLPVAGLQDDPNWLEPLANKCLETVYPIHGLGPADQMISDPDHDHAAIHTQITTAPVAGPPALMGGFVESYVHSNPAPSDPTLVMGYYDQAAVPVFDFFARNFTVCDHWFASLPTGTQANRFMAMSGTSPIVDNAAVFLPDQSLVYDWLSEHGISWCAYQWGDFLPFFSLMPKWLPEIASSLTLSALGGRGRFRRYARFADDWAAEEAMPSVIFVEPEYTDGPHLDPNDDHPPSGIAKGQLLLADLYKVLTSNPVRWRKTMMIVTYDEHGGFFDHLPPLPIPTVVGGVPFATTGVRVPAFVVSPQVTPGIPFDGNLDHTAILQLLADRFSPGQDYSAAVGTRQRALERLASVLTPAGQAGPPPLFPAADLAALAAVAGGPPAQRPAPSPASPPNVQAFHNVARKVQQDHPDLIAGPGWEKLRTYLARTVP